MTQLLRQWVLGLTGASILSAVALSLTQKGRVRAVTQVTCGALLTICLISPVMEFDFTSYAQSLLRYRAGREDSAALLRDTNDALSKVIIEERCGAYILDKAQVMGLSVSAASVTVKRGDGDYYYPAAAQITGGEKADDRLLALIEAELGIPRESVTWTTDANDE